MPHRAKLTKINLYILFAIFFLEIVDDETHQIVILETQCFHPCDSLIQWPDLALK